MNKPGKTGFAHFIAAAGYSKLGFQSAWKNEAAFRQESCLMLFMVPGALLLAETGAQVAILLGSCIIVIIVELLNSALEAVVDRIGSEHHELSGRAKDMGSAAVFMSLTLVVVCWAAIAFERFY